MTTVPGIKIVESNLRHIRKFNFKLIARLTGMLFIIMSVGMALPLVVSLYYRDGAQFDLFLSGVSILLLGLLLRNIFGEGATYELHEKESFWITALIWLVIPLSGALPYLFTGAVSTFTDAAFESISGFTTTGSSVITDLDHTPEGILVWRNLTQWIGGLGLIMFIVALLRSLDVGSVQLYSAEFSGTLQRKLHPRISTSVKLMWMLYSGLTATLFVLLLCCRNGFMDSFCIATSAISTGGFMIHNAGLAAMSDASLMFIIFFMFLSGVNIALLYRLVSGRDFELWHSEEFKIYLGLFGVAVAISVTAFCLNGSSVGKSLFFSLFHISSTISTCGLYIPAPGHWPLIVSGVTFILVVFGAMSGSTGGGLKLKRLMILYKYVKNYFLRMLHPNAVVCVKVDKLRISDDYINKIFAFVFMYIMFIVCGASILMLCGLNIPMSLCVAASNIGNLGPAPFINELGADFTYTGLPVLAKWTLMLLMLAGRIEIFAIVAVFSPAYWKRG